MSMVFLATLALRKSEKVRLCPNKVLTKPLMTTKRLQRKDIGASLFNDGAL